ncbi:MAG: ABC-2 family transporter protein [Oscillospiraceae bacterium]|jgi:ABC-2 type transport system permease protein|nr:ABC-2 family transporter protein [Oscillospiraceae bacterium]
MRPYIAMFKLKLVEGMQYRAAAWAGVTTQFFWGFMRLMILAAFYRSSSSEPPMEWGQLTAYIWLQQSMLALTMLWRTDNELLTGIRDGHVAYELCRPYDLYSFWFARSVGSRLANAALRFLPILVVAFLLPGQYRMTLPPNLTAFALFILSLALALLLVGAVSMFIYALTFITLTPAGSTLIVTMLSDFLSGMVIPVAMLPLWLRRVSNALPFRYMSDLPFRLYSGNISGGDAALQIGVQAAWIVALTLLGKLAFSAASRRIVVQGG